MKAKYTPLFIRLAAILSLSMLLLLLCENNLLLFHTITKLFGMVISIMIFIIGWNTKDYAKNRYLTFISISFLFISLFLFLHIISDLGVQLFTNDRRDSSQFCITARFIEAFSFLAAFLFIKNDKPLPAVRFFLGFAAFSIFILLSILKWNIFPLCFLEDSTPTPFNIYSESLIGFVLAICLILLFHYKSFFARKVWTCMIICISCTILSELAFIFNDSNNAIFEYIGHNFEIFSFYALYLAIVDTGLTKPYELSFKQIRDKQQELEKNREELKRSVEEFNCLHSISLIVDRENATLDEILQDVVNIIPSSRLHPQDTYAKIEINDKHFSTRNYACHTPFAAFKEHNADIMVNNQKVGIISVSCFHTDCNHKCLKCIQDDRKLLCTIASDLGRIIQRFQFQEELAKHNDELEDQYKQMFYSNAAVKLMIDVKTGQIVEANNSAVEYYGYDRQTLTSMKISELDILTPDERRKMVRSILNKRNMIFKLKHRLSNDQVRDVDAYIAPIVVKDRTYFYSTIIDTTDRIKAETLLLRSEARSKRAERIAQVAHFEYDILTDNLWCSSEAYRISEFWPASSKDIMNSFYSQIHPDDAEHFFRSQKEALKNKTELRIRVRIITPLGNLKYIQVVSINQFDSDGRLIGKIGTIMDITELMSSMKMSESLAEIVNISNNEVYVIDEQSKKFLYANKSAIANIGYSMEELSNMSPQDIIKEIYEDQDFTNFLSFDSAFENLIITNKRHYRKNGTTYEVEAVVQKFYYKDRKAYVAVVTDTTERNRLNTQLKQSDKMNALGQLVGGIAHDFNNSLAAIIGGAELLQLNNSLEGVNKNILNNILQASMSATELTKQLLTFARQNKVAKQDIDLKVIITNALAILRKTVDPIINISEVHPETDIIVNSDPSQLQSAILNICVNARDALEGTLNPHINICTKIIRNAADLPQHHNLFTNSKSYVALSISNNGPHIPAEIKENILEPFFTTKPEGKGTGLGLAMVFSTVKDAKGKIFIDSEEAEDTSFTIYLPLIHGKITQPQTVSKSITSGKGSILFVDDDDIVRDTFSHAIGAFGYHVICSENGAEALKTFEQNPAGFDLVITDARMPVMTGIELFRHLRALNSSQKIIMMSGHIGKDPIPEDVASGIVATLTKPVTLKHLSQVINETISGTEYQGE